MRAFITGITGQDGFYLSKLLLAQGYVVAGYARRGSRAPDKRIVMHEGDLSDPAALTRALDESRPTEIYNLGGQSHVGASFACPEYTFAVTAMPILHILEWVRDKSPATRVYQASTSELFGNELPPQTETTKFSPRSPYAVAKLAAHQMVRVYREAYHLFACSGILHNHESPRRPEAFVTRKITLGVARIKHGLQEKIALGNLLAIRDWGHAEDYVRAMWMMLQQETPEDFVIASGSAHSVQELVEIAVEEAGLPKQWTEYVEQTPLLHRPAEVYALKGDASRAHTRLGWRPKYSFEDLVHQMVQSDLEQVGNDLAKV